MDMNDDLFTRHRPFLLSLAYRMTGSLSDAEDIVQDTFAQCAETDLSTIKNQRSWLTKVCANKALDFLKLAHKKREVYPGVWLPDAVPDGFQFWKSLTEQDSPEKSLIVSESLTMSFLLMMERLTPEERVIYLLSEIFDYPFREIASLLDQSEEACRKTAQRARNAISKDQPKFTIVSAESRKIVEKFFEYLKEGDRSAIRSILADDSELWADGGGKVPAASTEVMKDADAISTFFAKLGSSPILYSGDYKIELAQVNGRPGALLSKKLLSGLWSFDTILSFEFQDGRIARIYAQRNPDKLKNLEKIV